MIDKLISIITVEPASGKRTFSLVMFAAAACFWYLTSDQNTWIYAHIEEVLTALGLGKVVTMCMAIANLAKTKA